MKEKCETSVFAKRHDLNIKIIVATHKKYRMPEDDIYLPIQLGAAIYDSLGYQGDNTGDNISTYKPYFCELTGLYWGWKNLRVDYLGVVHYRRHFCFRKKGDKWNSILNADEAQMLCSKYDIIVPTKRYYVIETLYSHYAHTFEKEHLDRTRDIVEEKFPAYLPDFDKCMKSTSGYMFNMFIMRRDLMEEYCSFLFPILFELLKRVDVSGYTEFQARIGRVGELLFNVWLRQKCRNNKLKIKEIKCLQMEPVNWYVKGTAFLKAKFLGKKYEESFGIDAKKCNRGGGQM